MKKKISKIASKSKAVVLRRSKSEEPSLEDVPRITNETVAEHREEVLKGARKYIYPLQHSKHRIIMITTTITVIAIIGFILYCLVGLYRFHQTNTFLYRVSQVIPFPIARIGGNFVSYENYLFEIRHYQHYYENKVIPFLDAQSVDSSDEQSIKDQYEEYQKTALTKVIDDAYIKKLAKEKGISVSDKELHDRIEVVRSQNRIGSDDKVFEDVLKEYWNWSIRDFERSLKMQMLREKLLATFDTAANQKAQDILNQLNAGANFAELAKVVSDEPIAKTTGGDYGVKIDKTNRNVPPQVVQELFKLQAGQNSGIINTGTSLEIVRVNEVSEDRVSASHIVINLQPMENFLKEIKSKDPVNSYISL